MFIYIAHDPISFTPFAKADSKEEVIEKARGMEKDPFFADMAIPIFKYEVDAHGKAVNGISVGTDRD